MTRPSYPDGARPAPAFEVEVRALNADPTPIEQVTVPAIVDHLELIVKALDSPPILIGHSAGGVSTQILTPQSSICHVLRWRGGTPATRQQATARGLNTTGVLPLLLYRSQTCN